MKNITLTTQNITESYDFRGFAQSANGSVLYTCGKSVLIASVCIQDSKAIEADFVPLSVQYLHKSYAVAKFPAGFIKREGKPSEFEILTSRLIDRTLRPLFPQGFCYNTHIVVQTLSYDGSADLALCALRAAASALFVSNIGIKDMQKMCVSAVRIARINGKFIVNPNMQQIESSELDLLVSGKGEELLMIEMNTIAQNNSANLLSEKLTLKALELAKDCIAKTCKTLEHAFLPYQKPTLNLELKTYECNALEFLSKHCEDSLKQAITQASKSERTDSFNAIIALLVAQGFSEDDAKRSIGIQKRKIMREMILKNGIRADGRDCDSVRKISIRTNLLPCAHGSALFTRGQTQVLAVCTLGSENDAQLIEPLGQNPLREKFLFHYNFPSFSVGETEMIGSPNRRELGHGNLARKALKSSIPSQTHTIRLVSEVLESNGSSSMASVCAGSLALHASGVQTQGLIAGVAMGLVSDTDRYRILTDITGLEDHDGDMDFKVAGNENGISALQMDIKIGGITSEILADALAKAKSARKKILRIMKKSLADMELNYDVLPKLEVFQIPTQKIFQVIGQGGKTIKGIIERFQINIDLDKESGEVRINGSKFDAVQEAKAYILELIKDPNMPKVGFEFIGKVKRVLDFGAFIELPNGLDGLVHISKVTKDKDKKAQEFFSEGSKVKCVVVATGQKIELELLER
ncbi:MAG: polyribonucleotide nucleotidyltransferase [Helicobacter sp.]|nr:polyribonucleotide nucleotidyltransferase [Helicobacter sp.]MDY5740674.1 polyribonucleotide nucleotidyltransferase [Helicobacter sp.]